MAAEMLKGLPAHMKLGFGLDMTGKKKSIIRDGDKDAPAALVRPVRTLETFGEMLTMRKLGDSVTTTKASADFVPRHVALMGHVLQFECYYLEAVSEMADESFRVRRQVLRYYLVDGTLELIEPTVLNSGLPQGKVLKRHVVTKAGGSTPIGPDDFAIGGSVALYGRSLKLNACNDFTRSWYESQGTPLAPNEPSREDAFGTRSAAAAESHGPDIFHGRKQNPMKQFMEASLGAGPRNQGRAQFKRFSGQVLRFYGQWDDTASMFGSKVNLRIMFYLADNTISMCEDYVANCGKDHVPDILKRIKLPKVLAVSGKLAGGAEEEPSKENFYNTDDLRVGSYFNVLGRDVLLYDCDEFTQKWYMDNCDVDQKANAVDVSEPVVVRPKPVPPPPTWFGSEEDSMASVKHLVPKVPKVNWDKAVKMSDKLLRFSAKLASTKPVDAAREFVVTWYLADDTMAIYEPPVRNSGIVGGPWMKRAIPKNSETGGRLVAGDLFVGARVPVSETVFIITGCDEGALKTMEGHASVWPMAKIDFVLATLRRKLGERSGKMQNVFRVFDKDKSHNITKEEFKFMLEYYGMDVTDAECVTIFRNYDKDRTGKLSFEQFCRVFAEDPTGVELDTKMEDDPSTGAEIAEYDRYIKGVELAEADEEKVKLVLLRFYDAFALRPDTVIGLKFREFDTNRDGSVSRAEFRIALSGDLGMGMALTADEVRVLEAKFFPADTDKIIYGKFITVLKEHANVAARRR